MPVGPLSPLTKTHTHDKDVSYDAITSPPKPADSQSPGPTSHAANTQYMRRELDTLDDKIEHLQASLKQKLRQISSTLH